MFSHRTALGRDTETSDAERERGTASPTQSTTLEGARTITTLRYCIRKKEIEETRSHSLTSLAMTRQIFCVLT